MTEYGNSRRKKSHLLFALVLLGALGSMGALSPVDISENRSELSRLFLAADFWQLTPDSLAERLAGLQFYWAAQDKSMARSQARFLTFNGQSLLEAVVRLADNMPCEVSLSFFNKGDAGHMAPEDFFRKAATISNMVATAAGCNGQELARPRNTTSKHISQSVVWMNPQLEYRLDTAWSTARPKSARPDQSTIQPEFIKLTLKPNRGQIISVSTQAQRAAAGFGVLYQKIKRQPNGDVWLDPIPMVDQGSKGYCAAAAAERVLRYYGLSLDQHDIAQRAATSAQGSNAQQFLSALKSVATAVGLQVRVVDNFDLSAFLKRVRDYNKEAQRQRKPEIAVPQSGVIDTMAIYARMDKNAFLQSRSKGGNLQARFMNQVQNKINYGFPLFWGVVLGFIDEPANTVQLSGGHMRLIIGYNRQTDEIIYSDTWGAGHEFKRMAAADAHAITVSLYSMEP